MKQTIESLNNDRKNRDIYVIGRANVGKSTFINEFLGKVKYYEPDSIYDHRQCISDCINGNHGLVTQPLVLNQNSIEPIKDSNKLLENEEILDPDTGIELSIVNIYIRTT